MDASGQPGRAGGSSRPRELSPGELARFEERYTRVAPALFSWAHLRMGPRLRTQIDPSDLVQETCVRALRSYSDFDPERGEFRHWIFRIAKNCRNEVLRRMSFTRPRVVTGEPDATISQCPDSVTSISRSVAREDTLQQLLTFLEEFPEVDRELFLRCGLQGEPTSRAAVRMGMSASAAQKRWARLRERLRDRPWITTLLEPEG